MSKASEYAYRVNCPKPTPPTFKPKRCDYSQAHVGENGNLVFEVGELGAHHVPDFIAWLKETFID